MMILKPRQKNSPAKGKGGRCRLLKRKPPKKGSKKRRGDPVTGLGKNPRGNDRKIPDRKKRLNASSPHFQRRKVEAIRQKGQAGKISSRTPKP